ncbi:MAG: hypothetical protein QOI44_383, partial [Actinomycetota bacterium]|nr:hypothetical protein [Actinomycetota bacterium]
MAGARQPLHGGARLARVFVAVLVGATGLFGAAEPASAAGSWSLAPTVNPLAPPTEVWDAVACPSASLCLAVGSSNGTVMTAQRWDGTGWSLVPIESSLLSVYPTFQGMACASASSCFAVGGYGYPPSGVLMARWNGTSWSLASAPQPAGATVASLSDVSCPSVSFCIATGNYENGGTDLPYSARWNGTSWSVVAMATPAGALDADINGVSCVGVSNCVAVGEYTPTSADDQTLIERWNGTVWTIVSSPTPVSVDNARLAGVSCPSSS